MAEAPHDTEVFLDNNATTRPSREVRDAMLFAMTGGFGNASSAHRAGEPARRLIAGARGSVASLVGAEDDQIVFTSGATESNNFSILSGLSHPDIKKLVTTEVEHSSIDQLARQSVAISSAVTCIPVDKRGVIELEALAEACSSGDAIVSTHWVNNETGVIQPVAAIADVCSEFNCLLHIDASQAVGKVPVKFAGHGIDYMTIAAHKFHGPQGVGAVCFKNLHLVRPLLFGGQQERLLRPGTENLPGIAGLGVAAEARRQNFVQVTEKLLGLRNHFERLVFASIPSVYINGEGAERVCNTSNLRFEGVDGQALVAQLDSEGIRCSQSSACTAQIPEPSYVLRAMGLTAEEAYASVRFSFSDLNTFEEIDKTIEILTKRVSRLRDFQGSLASI